MSLLSIQRFDKVSPEFLFELMSKQRLLPDTIANNPPVLVSIAENSKLTLIQDDESDKVLFLETRKARGILDLFVFIIDREVMKQKDEISALQKELREIWFATSSNDVRRVQAFVPVSRKNTKRLLLALGFVQETRDCGLRELLRFGPKVESSVVMGLLPSDPYRTVPVPAPEVKVEVA